MHKSVAIAPFLLLTLAACGGSGGSGSGAASTPSSGPSSATSGSTTAVHVASTSLGKVLVDGQGHTLYMLTADSPGHSTCNTQCLAYWPAVTPSASGASSTGVSATLASTAVAGGGKTVTADGWPLYTFIKDTAPGQVSGEGVATFGGVWYAVSPSGHPVKSAQSTTPTPTQSGGGGY